MICGKCDSNMRAINSRKCRKGEGSKDIPKNVRHLFDQLTYRSWRCEECKFTIKTIEVEIDEILGVAKSAKKELLKAVLKLI